jgi:hypothetical protein
VVSAAPAATVWLEAGRRIFLLTVVGGLATYVTIACQFF